PRTETLIVCAADHAFAFSDAGWMNPLTPGMSQSGVQFAFEPLALYHVLTGETVPWLAESWAYDEDAMGLTVRLRPGIRWSDGRPLTATDVVATLRLLRDGPATLRLAGAIQDRLLDALAPDELTVLLRLRDPDPRFFHDVLAAAGDRALPIVPAHVWDGQDPETFRNVDPAQGWPVVSGPYRLLADSADGRLWDRRDDWWAAATGFQALPAPRRILYRPRYDDSHLARLAVDGEVDTTPPLTPSRIASALAIAPALTLTSPTGAEPPFGAVDWRPLVLGFNAQMTPWDDPVMRRAVNHAIDRDELVRAGELGRGQAATLPFPDFPAFDPTVADLGPVLERFPVDAYDPAQTTASLRERGYARAPGGVFARDGQALALPIVTAPEHAGVAAVLVAQLRRAGIDATVATPPDASGQIAFGVAAAWLWPHGASVRDPYLTLDRYHGRHAVPTGEAAFFPARWRDGAFDAIVDRLLGLDPAGPDARAAVVAAMEIWLAALPEIPVLQSFNRIPLGTRYWTGWPHGASGRDPASWRATFLPSLVALRPAPPPGEVT
ncbi:MAG: ABC transporter substrate-binding protein, partial [Thermomicrobiales bacterium]